MPRDGIATPVEPGLIARLVQGVRYTLTGVRPDSWFGPGQPLPPIAQEQALGRQFDFDTATNMRQQPRATEAVSFAQMRALADGYDFLRLVIETRKDQLSALPWTVRPRDEKAPQDARCQQIAAFLRYPDQEHDWQTWLRMLVEDMLVLDAATIYPRMTRGGGLYALELVDGATIKRIIDETGRTPLPPDPAFQQVIKGMAAVNYSRDELVYTPRNPRTNRIYGYSPVEQIVMTVNIALRRQVSMLQYYTEGNVPEALIGVPENWSPEQIRMFQDYWDAMLAGDTAARRHAKFVPGGLEIRETKAPPMKDAYDEWLARVVCFAFGISPNAMIAQVNRATAEVSKTTADEEGLAPMMAWVASVMDLIVARWFGAPDLCFAWAERSNIDPLTQAQIDQIYVATGVKTTDEVRASLGLDPIEDDEEEPEEPEDPDGEEPDEDDEDDEDEGVGKAASFKPPAGVRSAARRGLELRRKWRRGGMTNSEASDSGIGSGVQRATNLANGDAVSMTTIRRMVAFFERHQRNYKPGKKEPDGGPTAGTIAWLLWGGNAGRAWANRIVDADAAKAAVIHNHITVQPPDVLIDIGETTINADFAGGARKTVAADRTGDGRLVGTIED